MGRSLNMYKYEKERELVNALFRRLGKGRWYLMKLEHGGRYELG